MNSWINKALFYEIYPTSFNDSNGDGIGDLNGITEKLDYVKDLGFNAIWINPIFKSPFLDGGYDITDYCAVDEKFGTIEDFERLTKRAKELGIKVVLDLVVGHTSNEHPWFKESAKFERNEYSDRYIWTDSIFNKYSFNTIHGLHPRDGGYYMNYYACQPALNYGFNKVEEIYEKKSAYDLGENWKMHYKDGRLKPLRDEVLRIMRFWLDKGADGFRVDMAESLVKGCVGFSDKDEDLEGVIWLWEQFIGTIKKEYPESVFVAEWMYPPNSIGKCGFDIDYIGHDSQEYNNLFRNEKDTNILPGFEQGNSYFSPNGKGNIKGFIELTNKFNSAIKGKGFYSIPSGYHDIVRLAEKKDEELLKTIFAFIFTFKNVPFVYYGDEIAMTHHYGISKDGGYIRTGARTPMQWTNGKNRGFSSSEELYLPVNDIPRQSVESMQKDPDSLYNMVKTLAKIRLNNVALDADAEISYFGMENGGYPLCYKRSKEGEKIYVYINPTENVYNMGEISGEILISNSCETEKELILRGKSFAIIKK